jgi:hypothetical protein
VTKVAILAEPTQRGEIAYRAIAGDHQPQGRTAGEALDALTAQLPDSAKGTLVVVQNHQPDAFFTPAQQERLQELMARWRAARDAGASLPPQEQRDLEALTNAEVEAATRRAAALLLELQP